MRLSVGIFTLIFLLSLSQHGFGQQFKTFAPFGEEFTLQSPCQMKRDAKEIMTDIGRLSHVSYSCGPQEEDKNFAYIISYVDYPEGTFHPDSLDLISDVLSESVEQQAEHLGGNIIYSADMDDLGFKGQLYRIAYKDAKIFVKGRVLLVGDRIYHLQVFALAENSLNDAMDVFLNSFAVDKSSGK
ncbi:MAG: hypothetical protein H6567_10580 [Lewinellaceae bacterium]|nr:hypothetical protein [Lewinellaceae bacterium]